MKQRNNNVERYIYLKNKCKGKKSSLTLKQIKKRGKKKRLVHLQLLQYKQVHDQRKK